MRDRRGRWPLVAREVEGRPIRVDGRELVPLVRVEKHVRRQASVGATRVTARGSAIVHMRPVAVRIPSRIGARPVLIRDETARAIRRLLLMAVFVGYLGITLRVLASRFGGRRA